MMKTTTVAALAAATLASALGAAQASTVTHGTALRVAPAAHASARAPHHAAGQLIATSRYAYGWRVGVPG